MSVNSKAEAAVEALRGSPDHLATPVAEPAEPSAASSAAVYE